MLARVPLTQRQLLLLCALGSAALLIGALLFQYLGGLKPCPLCIDQRYAHGAAITVALVGVLMPAGVPRTGLAALAVLVFLGSAGLAAFHVGVEQHWWAGLPGCAGGTLDDGFSMDSLRASAEAGPGARCDEIPWSMLGLSMAGWNAVASLGLAAVAAVAVFLSGRRSR